MKGGPKGTIKGVCSIKLRFPMMQRRRKEGHRPAKIPRKKPKNPQPFEVPRTSHHFPFDHSSESDSLRPMTFSKRIFFIILIVYFFVILFLSQPPGFHFV